MKHPPLLTDEAGAAIIIAGDALRQHLFAIIAITAVSTVVVIGASGAVTQIFYKIALARVKRRLYEAAHEQDGVNTKGVDAKLEREILSGGDKK